MTKYVIKDIIIFYQICELYLLARLGSINDGCVRLDHGFLEPSLDIFNFLVVDLSMERLCWCQTLVAWSRMMMTLISQ